MNGSIRIDKRCDDACRRLVLSKVTHHPGQRSSGQLRIVAHDEDETREAQLAQAHIERTSQAAAGRVFYHDHMRKCLANGLVRAVRGRAIDHDNPVLNPLQLFALGQQCAHRAEECLPAVERNDNNTQTLLRLMGGREIIGFGSLVHHSAAGFADKQA